MYFNPLIISGATSSGKTALGEELYNYFLSKNIKSAIINADAMQIYSEFDILTAVPKDIDCKDKYYLYKIINPKSSKLDFSVFKWIILAEKIINKMLAKNKIAIIIGGTGFYIAKLIYGIHILPEISLKNKEFAINFINNNSISKIKDLLVKLGDKLEYIDMLDKNRLARRLEIIAQTGKNINDLYKISKITKKNFNFLHININLERDILYKNIERNIDNFIKNGAIEEVINYEKSILDNEFKFNKDIIANKIIGYREIKSYLDNEIDKDIMINNIKKRTRNYAKRQLTFFRNQFKENDIINISSNKEIYDIVKLKCHL